MVRSTILRMCVISCVGAALAAGGCAHKGPPDLSIDPSIQYEGPPIRASAVDGQHALSIVVPTGGWEVQGERVFRYSMDNRIFLTLVRPDPAEMQSQSLVQFDVTPGVKIDEPLAVYVRVVEHDSDPDDSPFALAAAINPQRP